MAKTKKTKPGEPMARVESTALNHNDLMQASIRVEPELRRRSELLWEDRSPSIRGPKAGFTPEDIVLTAVGIADIDGLSAVTMKAVSTSIGLTTMAVYRYFPSKETLLDAVIDAGTGLPPSWTEPRESWRTEIKQWARAKRMSLCVRPWLAELPFVAAPHGPNWLSWLEAITDTLSRTGLNSQDIGGMLSIIDGYTRGASDTAISLARARSKGVSDEEWAAGVGADLGRALGDPRFPKFAAVIMAQSDGAPRTLGESFDFGLERVLDGIERYINDSVVPHTHEQ